MRTQKEYRAWPEILVLSLILWLVYAIAMDSSRPRPEIQACYDAGGEPVVSILDEFITCRGRRVK